MTQDSPRAQEKVYRRLEDRVDPNESVIAARSSFVGVGGVLGHLDRLFGDELPKVLDGRLELGVAAVEGRVRQVIDRDIRIDAVPLDEPFAFGAIDPRLRGGSDAPVDEEVR